jgi:hypothetical protein
MAWPRVGEQVIELYRTVAGKQRSLPDAPTSNVPAPVAPAWAGEAPASTSPRSPGGAPPRPQPQPVMATSEAIALADTRSR